MSAETDFDEDDMIAAELALGLLTGDDLADARRRAATEVDFAGQVVDWEIRLAELTEELEPVTPSPAAKRALMARVLPSETRKPIWQRLWLWQAASVVSLLLLAAVFFGDVLAPTTQQGPLYTAEIVSEAGDFRVVAVVDKTRDEIFLTRTAGAAPEGRILQVWAHGPDEPAESVGLWPEGDTVRLPMPPNIAAVDGLLTIGVSEEPPGGSLTGSPSGRVFGTVDIPGVTAPF